jgi:ABC-type methionine transport system ATPase subunit
MARLRVRLTFARELVTEPVIHEVGKRFEVVTNIRRADVTHDAGWVVLELTGEDAELERAVDFLTSRGVRVDPAEGDMVDQ